MTIHLHSNPSGWTFDFDGNSYGYTTERAPARDALNFLEQHCKAKGLPVPEVTFAKADPGQWPVVRDKALNQ